MKLITRLININKKKKFDIFKTKKKQFFNIIKVSKTLNNFLLNKKLFNFNLIISFLKKKKISILDTCILLDKIIPHYCYHFNLSIAGNCRMCLVEVSASLKPVASCAINLLSNQKISTNSFLVKRARQGIMEFLLVNHPLDCPICDQGGECDLQDQSLIYGSDRGRFFHISDEKRAVTEFLCNPFIKLILTRCIHCTRCIRFLNEIAGDYTLGMLGRGNHSEIGFYKNSTLISELSSNITDLCPVGALTIKTYALKDRPWEEIYLESIDLSNSLCVPLRISSDGNKITRVLPEYNTELEISWITDKTRFFADGLVVQQLDYPTLKIFSNLFCFKTNYVTRIALSWKNITYILLKKLKNNFSFICSYYTGDSVDLETMLYIKESSLYYSSNNIKSFHEKESIFTGEVINEDFDYNYIFTASNFNKYRNVILVNLNLRLENPLLNYQLRKKYIWEKNIKIYFLGSKYQLTYKYQQIGVSTENLLYILEGRHSLTNVFKKDLGFNLILYTNNLKYSYKSTFHRSFFSYIKILKKLFDIIYLAKSASSIGNFDLSFNRYIIKKKKINLIAKNNLFFYYICCNTLKFDTSFLTKFFLAHKIFIYQNSHGDNFFLFMDFFFPSYSYFEKNLGYYTNCFGILRKTRKILFSQNNFTQDNIDIIKLVQNTIYDRSFKYKNNNATLRLNNYIPLYLLTKQRYNLYNILEYRVTYTKVYFYMYSSKNKNFYKENVFDVYSANLNLISYTHFFKKTNLRL